MLSCDQSREKGGIGKESEKRGGNGTGEGAQRGRFRKGEGQEGGSIWGYFCAHDGGGGRKKPRMLLTTLDPTFQRVCLCGRGAPAFVEMCGLLSDVCVERGGCVDLWRRVKP